MRKYTLSALLIFLCSAFAYSQSDSAPLDHRFRLGVKVGPVLSSVKTKSFNNTTFRQNGNSLEFLLGAFIDMRFRENYYFQFGVNFVGRNTDVTATNPVAGEITEAYDHEYLQLPFLVKLYTDELMLDTNFFVHFGVVPQIRLSSRDETANNQLITEFYAVDLAGNIGGGVEHSLGVSTRVFAALSYNLGLVNMVADQSGAYDGLDMKSRMFALEIGLKF